MNRLLLSLTLMTISHSCAADEATTNKGKLAIDSRVAVKETKTEEIVLPGVMRIEGESVDVLDPSRGRKIQLGRPGSQTVFMSAQDPNLIELPFLNPHITASDALTVFKRSTSNKIYVAFNPEFEIKPRQIFIESVDGVAVLSLQLVPKNIVSQTIIVEGAPTRAVSANQSSEYVGFVQQLMESVALGVTPAGYSVFDMNVTPIVMNGLLIEPQRKFSSLEGDIFIYRVTNPTTRSVYLKESEFDGEQVAAVSIHPTPLIQSQGKTNVFVLTRRIK